TGRAGARLRASHRLPGQSVRRQRHSARPRRQARRAEGDLRVRAQGDDEPARRRGGPGGPRRRPDRGRRQRPLHRALPPPLHGEAQGSRAAPAPAGARRRRRRQALMHGWLVIDKPVGPGSTQIVGAVKRALREGGYPKVKVGHGGTLDPLASGVLPIALGEATKLSGRMLDADKLYEFTVEFGAETDTLDAE